MKIGFFDSGLGGLTVLQAVVKELPDYDYYYYGDTAHLPYGDKTEEEIYSLTITGMEYLFAQGCQLVVIACNTASAETARKLQTEFLPTKHPDRKVLGIIIPTIEVLAFDEPTNVVLIGTKRTVESGKYSKELQLKGDENALLTEVPTPALVPLIEANKLDEATKHAMQTIKTAAPKSRVVVLACTHYTQIKKNIREQVGEGVTVISQDEVVPYKLKKYLDNHPEIEEKLTKEKGRTIHLTEHRASYDKLIEQFLGGVIVEEK